MGGENGSAAARKGKHSKRARGRRGRKEGKQMRSLVVLVVAVIAVMVVGGCHDSDDPGVQQDVTGKWVETYDQGSTPSYRGVSPTFDLRQDTNGVVTGTCAIESRDYSVKESYVNGSRMFLKVKLSSSEDWMYEGVASSDEIVATKLFGGNSTTSTGPTRQTVILKRR